MATITLVEAGAHRLRYLIEQEGTAAEVAIITTIGGATPDTFTDSIGSGVIKLLSKAVAQGYKSLFPAGAQTQADARALWLSDLSGYIAALPLGSTITIENFKQAPTAICRLTARDGANSVLGDIAAVDAIVNAGNPEIVVTLFDNENESPAVYLDIEVPGTIGD